MPATECLSPVDILFTCILIMHSPMRLGYKADDGGRLWWLETGSEDLVGPLHVSCRGRLEVRGRRVCWLMDVLFLEGVGGLFVLLRAPAAGEGPE